MATQTQKLILSNPTPPSITPESMKAAREALAPSGTAAQPAQAAGAQPGTSIGMSGAPTNAQAERVSELANDGSAPGTRTANSAYNFTNDDYKNYGLTDPKTYNEAKQDYMGFLKRQMDAYTPENAEQRQKRLRREKMAKVFNAIGDGVSSLANLYFVSQGAPRVEPASSLSKAYQDRLDKAMKERQEHDALYYNAAARRLKAIDDEYDKAAAAKLRQRTMQMQQEQADRNVEYMKARIAGQQQNNDYYAARAKKEQAVADAQADLMQAQLDLANAKTSAQKAAAQARLTTAKAAMIRASKSGGSGGSGGGSGSVKEFRAPDENGNEHRFKSKAAAEQYAREHHTWITDYATTTTSKFGGAVKTTTTSPRGGHAAPPRKKAAPKPHGSGGSGKGGFGSGHKFH